MIEQIMTAEEYLNERYELPDGGQFSELVAGKLNTYQPPDLIHGDVIFNLTKQLGNYLHTTETGYACYELGLKTTHNPDTIRYPAVSIYVSGDRFAHLDDELTETAPELIIEVASTNDRRRDISTRITEYHQYGTKLLWIIDSHEQELITHTKQGYKNQFGIGTKATANELLPDFAINISQLFQQPKM